jgi:HD-like signal output (HDOD) protein
VTRILFVDDQRGVLDGLRDLLRPQRKVWDMAFAESGEQALAELERWPFDVIVSDLRMPGMDGATLLRHVTDRFPSVIRIVLSGNTELEVAHRAVPFAHQFLTKPCNPDTLRETIDRSCQLHSLLADPALRRAVHSLDRLPSVPRLYAALTKTLAAPNSTAADVAAIVDCDPAMCAKILQLVNSGFCGVGRRITQIAQAITYLGFNTTKNLVLCAEVFAAFASSAHVPGFSIEAFQAHSLVTGRIAALLCPSKSQRDDAFMAGMLHDVGTLIYATQFPTRFSECIARSTAEKVPLFVLERQLLGVSHAEIGAYLLGVWGLPAHPIVEAVANHHEPTRAPQTQLDVLAAVHIAELLAHEQAAHLFGAAHGVVTPIDAAYLDALGVADRVESWRTIAADVAQTLSQGKEVA